jgi:hypothetical protein
MQSYMCKFAIVLAVACMVSEATLLTSNSPDSLTVAQGDKLSLFCESDDTFDYCQWEHIDTQTKCNLASNDVGSAIECKANKRLTWDVTQNKCGIAIQQVTRDDIGSYECYMFAGNTSNFVRHTTKVDVAVPALVTFSGMFNTDSEVRVKNNDLLTIECQAMGGYPAPQLRAAIGSESSSISNDPKADHALEELTSENITNSDGTFDVKKTFRLLVQPHDCGKFVKCEAGQVDKQGNEIFGRRGKVVEHRKLMVLFAPEPLFKPLPPFQFGPSESVKSIRMQFMANPAPANNRAIWHINPTRQVGPDSIVLQAGSSHKDKYEAMPLNVTGHSTVAVLNIKHLAESDAAFEYFLEVTTDVGSQRYNFALEYRPQAPLIEAGNGDDESGDAEKASEDDGSTSGMGVGIVVGIILLVLLVLGAIAGVMWMRANKKFCFAVGSPKAAPNPGSDGSDQMEKGEEPTEKDNLKNNGV